MIVDTEKGVAGSGWARNETGGKVVAQGCASNGRVCSECNASACIMDETPSHIACIDAHIVSAHHIALILCTTSMAQGSLHCVPKIVFVFCAVSHAMHSTLSTSSSTSPTIIGLQRLITSRISCADPREPRGNGFTDPEPRTGYEPNRVESNHSE